MDDITKAIHNGIRARHEKLDAHTNNLLEKGAGDRGGKVIGTTKSGKPKYEKKDAPSTSMHSSNDEAHKEQVSRARKAYDTHKDSKDPKAKAAAAKAKAFLDSAKKRKLSKSVEVMNDLLEKGKAMPVGTVSNGRKKQANGNWVPVKDGKGSGKKDEEAAARKELADLNKKDKDYVDKRRKEGVSLAGIADEQKSKNKSESAADKAMRESKADSVSERESKAVSKIKMMASASTGGKLGAVNENTGMVKTFAKMYDLSPKRVVELAEKHGGAISEVPTKLSNELKDAVAADVREYTKKRGMLIGDAMDKVAEAYQKDLDSGRVREADKQGYKDAIAHVKSERKKLGDSTSSGENKPSGGGYANAELQGKIDKAESEVKSMKENLKKRGALDSSGNVKSDYLDSTQRDGGQLHLNAVNNVKAYKEAVSKMQKLNQEKYSAPGAFKKSIDQSMEEAYDILEKGAMTQDNKFAKNPKDEVKKKLDKMFDPENEKDVDKISKSEEEEEESEDEMEKGMSAAYETLEKGLKDDFMYGGDKFKVSKLGKDVIESLDKSIAIEKENIVKYKAQAEVFKGGINGEPTDDFGDYRFKPFKKESFENSPKRYSFEYEKTMSSNEHQAQESESALMANRVQGDLKSKYNRCMGRVVESMCEIKTAELMKGGIEKGKKYDLSISQAASLGI